MAAKGMITKLFLVVTLMVAAEHALLPAAAEEDCVDMCATTCKEESVKNKENPDDCLKKCKLACTYAAEKGLIGGGASAAGDVGKTPVAATFYVCLFHLALAAAGVVLIN